MIALCAAPARRLDQAVELTRDEDDEADEELRPVGGDADQDEPVLHDREQGQAEDGAEHGADAAGQAGAAEDDGGEHVEFLADEHRRRDRLGELRLHQRGDAGDQAHVAVDEEIEAEDVEAEPLRGVRIAAHRVDLAADVRAVEQQPGGGEGTARGRGSAG